MIPKRLQQFRHELGHLGKHFDVLVSVEVRGLQALVTDDLHLPLQFGPDGRVEPAAVTPQPDKQGKNAGKTAGRIEQLGRVAARKRPTLGEIQMDAQIERPVGVVQPRPGCCRGKPSRRVFSHQPFPLLQCAASIGRIGQ